MSNHLPVRLITTLMAAFVFFAPSLITAHEPFANDEIAFFKHAVVIVTTYDDRQKPLIQGSGFFIAPNQIVTNLHVVNHACEIRIKTFAGRNFTVKSVVANNESTDLALLQLEAPCPNSTTLQVEDELPSEGESIILLSSPQGSPWKVSHGQVGRIWEFESTGRRLQISAGVFPGSSGGPVLNRKGHVIGIAVMRMDSAEDLNFAIPAESLKTLRPSASIAAIAMGQRQPTQPTATFFSSYSR